MPEEIQFGETSRYNSHPSGVECIEVAEEFNFNLGNVIKYIWRSRYGDELSDPVLQLKKAEQYLHREIVRLYAELNADGPDDQDRCRVGGVAGREELLFDQALAANEDHVPQRQSPYLTSGLEATNGTHPNSGQRHGRYRGRLVPGPQVGTPTAPVRRPPANRS